ncbi:MAG: hypothetical protein ACI9QN_000999 [Arcticibacterium sp.]|jgi:hypothetical protein
MDNRILDTLRTLTSFLILRCACIKFLVRIQTRYNYSKYRVRPILKFINLFFLMILVTVIIAIWGVAPPQLLPFITSVLAVIGIALFAQWFVLSNISSTLIIFISHPVKLGNSISFLEKDFDVKVKLSDAGPFYVMIKMSTSAKMMIPNNLFLPKATKVNS